MIENIGAIFKHPKYGVGLRGRGQKMFAPYVNAPADAEEVDEAKKPISPTEVQKGTEKYHPAAHRRKRRQNPIGAQTKWIDHPTMSRTQMYRQ